MKAREDSENAIETGDLVDKESEEDAFGRGAQRYEEEEVLVVCQYESFSSCSETNGLTLGRGSRKKGSAMVANV